jgi:tetratricopeptide (TPR) repeat protein
MTLPSRGMLQLRYSVGADFPKSGNNVMPAAGWRFTFAGKRAFVTEQGILNRAFALHQQGNLAEAERLYRQVAAAEPKNFWAWYLLGTALSHQRRGPEALAAADKALALNPNMVEALCLRGILAQTAGRPDQAVLAFSRAAAIKPEQPDILYNRGVALTDLGRTEEALASFDKTIKLKPDHVDAWNNRGARLQDLGRLDEALESYARALAVRPDSMESNYNRGAVLQRMGRFEEAIVSFDRALALNSGLPGIWTNRGLALQSLERFEEALASHDRALAIRADHAGTWNNRGTALQALKRHEEATRSYEKALTLEPRASRTLFNLGRSLWDLKRFDEAVTACDKGLAIEPDYAEGWSRRGQILRDWKKFDAAEASFNKALALVPDLPEALYNLAAVFSERGRVSEGMALYTRHAQLSYGAGVVAKERPDLPHKRKHDAEQREYLAARNIDAAFHLEDGARLPGPAINPANASDIAAQWRDNRPQIVVVDNLLTLDALEKLRRFCWGSTIWHKDYEEGYLGAMPEGGFSCPLLAQIADELRDIFPTIFKEHGLRYLWGFKYDSTLSGIAIHADFAAVNVNFWITPDEANLDPASGGLEVWDIAAPLDWDFDKYNRDPAGNRAFLEKAGAKSVKIPYRANRAVIFDSNLFHKSDTITFQQGYLNRRINVTMLYGDR